MVMGQNLFQEGMLVRTKWRRYLSPDFGPFAIKISPQDLSRCLQTNIIPRIHFENLPQNSPAVVIRLLENNDTIILMGENLYCIKSDFLEPLQ